MNSPKLRIAGTGEKMQYLVHEFNDNTVRFVLRYPGRLDPNALRMSARAIIESVEVLHSSFHSGNIGAYWLVNHDIDDESFFRFIETDGDPCQEALKQALLPVLQESPAQLRCCLVQSSEASAVALNISHLCTDGVDGKYLLEKLAEGYKLARSTGSCAGLSVKNGSRAAEQVYETLEKRDMLSLLKNPSTGIKSPFPYPDKEQGEANIIWQRIPAQLMSAAREKAKNAGATANDLLLAACYRAYASLPGIVPTAPMSIMSMLDLRRHCKNGESEGLGNMTGSLPTALRNGVGASFGETLAMVAAQTTAVKDDPLAGLEGMPILHGLTRTLPMWLLEFVAGKLYGSMGTGLTNLGKIDCSALALDGLRPDTGWFGGPLKKKPAVQVSAASFDGVCTLSILGDFTPADMATLQDYLNSAVDEIERYVHGE